jgi:hypothetical protein
MAVRQLHRLSALRVAKEIAPGHYADGGGLYMQIADRGALRVGAYRHAETRRFNHPAVGLINDTAVASILRRRIEWDSGVWSEDEFARIAVTAPTHNCARWLPADDPLQHAYVQICLDFAAQLSGVVLPLRSQVLHGEPQPAHASRHAAKKLLRVLDETCWFNEAPGVPFVCESPNADYRRYRMLRAGCAARRSADGIDRLPGACALDTSTQTSGNYHDDGRRVRGALNERVYTVTVLPRYLMQPSSSRARLPPAIRRPSSPTSGSVCRCAARLRAGTRCS